MLMELFVSQDNNVILYEKLWENDTWSFFGSIIFYVLPILTLFVFYKLWDPSLGKKRNWAFAGLVSILLVPLFQYVIFNYSFEILFADPEQIGEGVTYSDIVLVFLIFSTVIGAFSSLVYLIGTYFFRFSSSNNSKNPF
jgi:hypothetical protein